MGPLWHSSSQSKNRRNADGAVDVTCYECGRFIGRTYEKIFRAKCALCEKTAQGIAVPEEIIRQYHLSKAGKEDISMLLLPREPKIAKFSFNTLTGYLLRALGIPRDATTEEPRSVEIAKSKKRPRLFEDVQLGEPSTTNLGMGMMELDEKSKKQE